MISFADSMGIRYANHSISASPAIHYALETIPALRHKPRMLEASAIVKMLRDKGVRNRDVMKALNLPSSAVSNIFKGTRRLQVAEVQKLIQTFELGDDSNEVTPPDVLNMQAARLFVLHAAKALGAPVHGSDPLVQELAEDLQGFVAFASDPAVRDQLDRAQEFFLGRLPSERRSAS